MSPIIHHLRVRPRLLVSLLAGALVAVLVPTAQGWLTRVLFGWGVAVWLYLLLVVAMMLRADHGRLRQVAAEQSESAATVMVIVSIASIVSLIGVVLELSAAKSQGPVGGAAWPHLALAFATVVGSWFLIPTAFALTYASVYYRVQQGSGFRFPGADARFRADYRDFLYFSFTIAVACQTADVEVTTTAMRRFVLLHSMLSFLFNTAILAFSINIAASMF